MMQAWALIVDDEPDIRELLDLTLMKMGITTCSVGSLQAAYQQLDRQSFNLCLTDMRLPDGDGIELVRHIQKHYPHLPVAVITAYGNMDTAIRAMKCGAFDFIAKPVDLATLRALVHSALSANALHGVPEPLAQTLLGDSVSMQQLRQQIAKLARSQAPVHISGESGVGKELVARSIHQQGPRRNAPFVAINCGAIPHDLMESEFFGHKKGSFTGAVADKMGLFQAAQGGTLFLDEVADLPATLQVKLLRAIQEKKVRPVGTQQEIAVDVRLLSATHKNLAQMVQAGEFRQDLYYRINVIELNVPPLRARREDIPQLATALLARLGHGSSAPTLTPQALSCLLAYDFPGNIRELENILERALALCEGEHITPDDLNLPQPQFGKVMLSPAGDAAATENFARFLQTLEKQSLRELYAQHGGDVVAAAQQWGLSPRSLAYRFKLHGIA